MVSLAAFAGPRVAVAESCSQNATLAQIENLETALETFRNDMGRFPSMIEGLEALSKPPPGLEGWRGPYLKAAVVDSWGQPFVYRLPSQYGSTAYDVYSKGRNVQDDHGEHDDITNWSGVPRTFYPRPFRWAPVIVAVAALVIAGGVALGLARGIGALHRRLIA